MSKGGREGGRGEGRKGRKEGILPARNTYCWVDMANLSSPPYVQLILLLLFGCFPVHWIVEIHAFGILPLPVSPDQVATHAQQGYDHWRRRHITLGISSRLQPAAQTSVRFLSPLLLDCPLFLRLCFCIFFFCCWEALLLALPSLTAHPSRPSSTVLNIPWCSQVFPHVCF